MRIRNAPTTDWTTTRWWTCCEAWDNDGGRDVRLVTAATKKTIGVRLVQLVNDGVDVGAEDAVIASRRRLGCRADDGCAAG